MGRRYAVDLIFPSRQAEAALLAAGEIALQQAAHPIRVEVEPGRGIELPFTAGFSTAPARLTTEQPLILDTVLLFTPDDAIRSDLGFGSEVVGGVEYAAIGYIYLTVRLGRECVILSFAAATSGMSDLFLVSDSVRGRFLALLERAGGLGGMLDVNDARRCRSLTHPYRWIDLDFFAFVRGEGEQAWEIDVDGYATAALAGSRSAASSVA